MQKKVGKYEQSKTRSVVKHVVGFHCLVPGIVDGTRMDVVQY